MDINYYHNSKNNGIFKRNDTFKGFGFELEIDGSCNQRENEDFKNIRNATIEKLYNTLNEQGINSTFEEDGSLNRGIGFELISEPIEAEQFKKFNFNKLAKIVKNSGVYFNNCVRTGLHIHFSKSLLGDNINEQAKVLARMAYFIDNNYNKIVMLSKRNNDQAEQYAHKINISFNNRNRYDYLLNAYKRYDISENGYIEYMRNTDDRYTALNWGTGQNTFEYRLGNSIMDTNAMNKQKNFLIDLIKKAKKTSFENMNKYTINDKFKIVKAVA